MFTDFLLAASISTLKIIQPNIESESERIALCSFHSMVSINRDVTSEQEE
jgi:hypothetical protein